MSKQPCVYIMTNKRNGTLYTGVTSTIYKRVEEHKTNAVEGFTQKYKLHTLVYVEVCETMYQAIEREKQIKGGSRKKKLLLIEKDNPTWKDLSSELLHLKVRNDEGYVSSLRANAKQSRNKKHRRCLCKATTTVIQNKRTQCVFANEVKRSRKTGSVGTE